tara:strand:+ start:353 stop:532 length:180 start_codon:yes stop_codon:yes gene_type:complete
LKDALQRLAEGEQLDALTSRLWLAARNAEANSSQDSSHLIGVAAMVGGPGAYTRHAEEV